jgi:uncharacterized HAD superfamily protein
MDLESSKSKTEEQDKTFNDFLIAEYNNIAKAHFKGIETISTFFKHYLLIMSVPIGLLVALFGIKSSEGNTTLVNLPNYGPLPGILLIVIAVVGLAVCSYITHLRMDVLLYARTVNGIRKYFYDLSKLRLEEELLTRVLPKTTHLPQYLETHFFFPVVFTFAVINSFYLFLAIILWKHSSYTTICVKNVIKEQWPYIFFIPLSMFVLHFLAYYRNARYREHKYLRSSIVGADIDGVLNKHKEHFCELLKENAKIILDPKDITIIPVHECSEIPVLESDEKKVFNDPKYWTKMPSIDKASQVISKLKNIFNQKIYIFSYRDWPQLTGLDAKEQKNINASWEKAVIQKINTQGKFARLLLLIKYKLKMTRGIDVITRTWLKDNNIRFDKLIIEKGSEHSADPRGKFRNRFYISRKKSIRFFMEDDLEKARKLAFICEVVFLIDQPYNQCQPVELPKNIIRVKSWDEIYKSVRKFS